MPRLHLLASLAFLLLSCDLTAASALPKLGLGGAKKGSETGVAGAWKEAIDPSTGRTYYWNTKTRESRWTKPSASPPAESPAPTPTSQPADQESDEDEFEGEYMPGEADFEEYTATNPSKPRRRPLAWMMKKARGTDRREPSSRGGAEGGERRNPVLQGVYLGSVLAAAAAFL